MITATNITQEQIHELYVALKNEAQWCPCGCLAVDLTSRDNLRACIAAMATEILVSQWTREAARVHCAELLNARATNKAASKANGEPDARIPRHRCRRESAEKDRAMAEQVRLTEDIVSELIQEESASKETK